MTKKKRKAVQLEAWCWYCDREFEDEKILLQHQKSKHYRCPQCPRRLNTAGGLAVHLTQVHKAEPDRLENTLPGRDMFDIEIYGMAGIPESDLVEWKSRKEAKRAANGDQTNVNKRPKIEKIVLTREQLRIQLQAHKALMSGETPTPGFPPPLSLSRPPPPLLPTATLVATAPVAAVHPPIPPFSVPPPSLSGLPPPLPFNPNVPPPNLVAAGFPPPLHPLASAIVNPQPYSSHIPSAQAAPPSSNTAVSGLSSTTHHLPLLSPHQTTIQSGAKSRMVFTDSMLCPEEKLAQTVKYIYRDSDPLSSVSDSPSSNRLGHKVRASDLF